MSNTSLFNIWRKVPDDEDFIAPVKVVVLTTVGVIGTGGGCNIAFDDDDIEAGLLCSSFFESGERFLEFLAEFNLLEEDNNKSFAVLSKAMGGGSGHVTVEKGYDSPIFSSS